MPHIPVVTQWWRSLGPQDRKALLWLIAVGFVLRAIFVTMSLLDPPLAVQVDTFRYMAIANAEGFASWFDLNDPAGYPLLLWLTDATLDDHIWTLLLQLVLSTLTIALTWELGRPYLSRRANILLAALITINPVSLFFSSQLMTETSFSFFFLLTIVIVLRKPRSWRAMTWAGALLGFATLIRPSSGITMIAITIVCSFFALRDRASLKPVLAFTVASWLVVLSFMIGLKIRYDYFGLSMKGPTMFSIYYTTPMMHSLGYSDKEIDSTLGTLPAMGLYIDASRPDSINGRMIADAHSDLFMSFLLRHPLTFAKIHLMGVGQMLLWPSAGLFQFHRHFDIREQNDPQFGERQFHEVFYAMSELRFDVVFEFLKGQLRHSSPIILIVWAIGALLPPLTLLLAMAGLYKLFRRWSGLDRASKRDLILILAVFLTYVFIVPQIAASTRFRMPIEPFLALFACMALAQKAPPISEPVTRRMKASPILTE